MSDQTEDEHSPIRPSADGDAPSGSWRSTSGVVTIVGILAVMVGVGYWAFGSGPEPVTPEPVYTPESVDWSPTLGLNAAGTTQDEFDEYEATNPYATAYRDRAAVICGYHRDDLEFSHITAFLGTTATVFRHPEGAAVAHDSFYWPNDELVRAGAFCFDYLPEEFRYSNRVQVTIE